MAQPMVNAVKHRNRADLIDKGWKVGTVNDFTAITEFRAAEETERVVRHLERQSVAA